MTKKKKRTRRKFSAEEKATILRRHMADKVPVSDLCDEYGLQPSVFYNWQRQLFANMELALEKSSGRRSRTREQELEEKVEHLEERIVYKDEVIAEISAEFVAAKNGMGGSERPLGPKRYGKVNEHNGQIPRDHWLEQATRSKPCAAAAMTGRVWMQKIS